MDRQCPRDGWGKHQFIPGPVVIDKVLYNGVLTGQRRMVILCAKCGQTKKERV